MPEDPIDALSRLNPAPEGSPVELPDLKSIPDAHRDGRARPLLLIGTTVGGLVLGSVLAAAVFNSTEPAHRCAVVNGRVIAADGVCLGSPGLDQSQDPVTN